MRPPIEEDAEVLRRLGIEVDEKEPGGTISLSLRVVEDMLNASGRCHGGILFSLADTAAAYATFTDCDRKPVTVAAEIRYLKSAHLGDLVTVFAQVRQVTEKKAEIELNLRRGEGDNAEVLAEAKATCLMMPKDSKSE